MAAPMINFMTYGLVRLAPSMLKWFLLVMFICTSPARAVTLLRDADIEYALKQVASPILKAAGLSTSRTKILVVDDPNLNAFVVSNDAIFLNSGLIARMGRVEALQGVIAHEAAHIANGHITRRAANLGTARTAASLGLALAALAAAAGGGEAAVGIAIGTQSSAQRAFFRHTQAEESSADASALQYMRSAGVTPSGMLDVLDLFRGQEALRTNRQDPYVRSHPLSRDRYRRVASFAAAYPDDGNRNPTASYWFERAKGKLSAYKRAPRWTLNRAKDSPSKDIALMREAIAHSRNSKVSRAIKSIDAAIRMRPKDPFLYDLKGEILMKSRNFGAAAQAYSSAARLAPRDALILAGYGRALLATGQTNAARQTLEKARSIDFRDGIMLRTLAQAYAKSGQPGMASLVNAERYALRGNLSDAHIHAKRATDLLSEGSGPWQRAQDVLLAAERAAKSKKRR